MYRIGVYIPEESTEKVKNAMFEAGGGHIGNYDYCSWQTSGIGQFRPRENSNPVIGQHGKIETVKENRVEMICTDEKIKQVIDAMKRAHPYEVVAYDVVRMEDF